MDDATKLPIQHIAPVNAETKPKRVRGPRRGKKPIEVAAIVHAEASKGWTEADYALFGRVLQALKEGL